MNYVQNLGQNIIHEALFSIRQKHSPQKLFEKILQQ